MGSSAVCRNRNDFNFFALWSWPAFLFLFLENREIQLMLLTFPITQKLHLNRFHVEQLFERCVRWGTFVGSQRLIITFTCISRSISSPHILHLMSTLFQSPFIVQSNIYSHFYFLSVDCLSNFLWSHLASGYCLSLISSKLLSNSHKKIASRTAREAETKAHRAQESSFTMCQIIWEAKKLKFLTFDDWKWLLAPKQKVSGAKVYIAEFITAEIFNVSGLGEKRQAPSRPKTAESIFHSLWPRAKASGPRGICLIFPS